MAAEPAECFYGGPGQIILGDSISNVPDDRYACQSCRNSADHVRLQRIGMDYFRSLPADKLPYAPCVKKRAPNGLDPQHATDPQALFARVPNRRIHENNMGLNVGVI